MRADDNCEANTDNTGNLSAVDPANYRVPTRRSKVTLLAGEWPHCKLCADAKGSSHAHCCSAAS